MAPGGAVGREVPVHRLRPNETVWTPPSLMVLDTETTWADEGPDEVHRLRLWVCAHVDRRSDRKQLPGPAWGWGRTADSLGEWITAQFRGRDCVWLYAHNLNFDLVTTALPVTLAAHGWEVGRFSVHGGAPWMTFRRGRKVLTVCDSHTWVDTTLAKIGAIVGLAKGTMPADDAPEGEWVDYCGQDVKVLTRAMLELMAWWDERRLGRWSISGAGSGYNAMRHVPSPVRHVIDVTPELVSQDRDAVRGGRKDGQRVGSADGGPWVELDLEAAYPTVAAHLPLPTKRAWRFDSLPVDSPWVDSHIYSPCAQVVVCTDRPDYPVRHDGVTWYPVGRFATTLAGPELRACRDAGHLESIGAGQMHKLGYALRPWATWVLDPTEQGTVDVPPIARAVARRWGRSTIGKFAGRTSTSQEMPGPAEPGWHIQEGWDGRVGRKGAEVTMAGRKWWVTYDADTENCYPAVVAWVESEVRVRLNRVLHELGGAWWTCDTDGVLVDLYRPDLWVTSGAAHLGALPRDAMGVAESVCRAFWGLTEPLRLRPKRVFESLAVLGPQHLTAGGVRKMAGVPTSAVETGVGEFTVRDWPGLKAQLGYRRPGAYTRPRRVVRYSGPTVHRWVAADGSCWPVEMTIGAGGANVILPWASTRWKGAGVRLAGLQYRKLQALSL